MKELIRRSREGIQESPFFVALGTRDYAKSIRNPSEEDHHLIIEQIAYAKSLGRITAILMDESLSEEDKQTIRDALKGMNIVGEFPFKMGDEKSMELAVSQMVDKFKDQGGK